MNRRCHQEYEHEKVTYILHFYSVGMNPRYIEMCKSHLARLNIHHATEILKEPTLKHAHIYCIVHNISAQQYGPLLEKYLLLKNNFTKNAASDCKGDCQKENTNVEIKTSLGGASHDAFNWVQLRLSHDIQYYILTAYHLTSANVESGGDLYVFRVPKEDMISLLTPYGKYAHGTKKEHGAITNADLKDIANKKEYALRPSYGDKCWQSMLTFRVSEESL